ncbi:MAG: ANL family adenylate-forming protein [Bdellovibrionota bacterium]
MSIDAVLAKCAGFAGEHAFWGEGGAENFGKITAEYTRLAGAVAAIPPGSVVAAEIARYDAASVALLLALGARKAVIIPVYGGAPDEASVAAVGSEFLVSGASAGALKVTHNGKRSIHPLLEEIRQRGHAGLVVFTSGTTGKPKGALHDFDLLLGALMEGAKPRLKRVAAFNHVNRIAGIYMLFSSIASGSSLVNLPSRQAMTVAETIQKFRIQVLPCAPSFLSLFLLSRPAEKFDLSSLELINYGSEPMNDFVLAALREMLPAVTLRQVFGTTEIGLIKTKTISSDSPFFLSGDPSVKMRVRDGVLEIKTPRAMMGYLNESDGDLAERDNEGWLSTGDSAVESEAGIRVLGRMREAINVGGRTVSPILVEGVIQSMPNVAEVTVCAEENMLLGHIVKALVCLKSPQDLSEFRSALWAFCRGKLEKHQIPQKVELVEGARYIGDVKKSRTFS